VDSSISISADGTVAVVVAAGDIDLATHAAMDSAIQEAVATPGVDLVVVDLALVDFLDSSGIAGLIRGRRAADAAGVKYRVEGARGIAQQVLEVSGVWGYLSDRGDLGP
jgi:anti-sigma B factor antagonist